MNLSDQQYSIYRDRVVAAVGKSKPELIHRINGRLGLVGDSSRHARSARARGEEAEALRLESAVDEYVREIAAATGVHP